MVGIMSNNGNVNISYNIFKNLRYVEKISSILENLFLLHIFENGIEHVVIERYTLG